MTAPGPMMPFVLGLSEPLPVGTKKSKRKRIRIRARPGVSEEMPASPGFGQRLLSSAVSTAEGLGQARVFDPDSPDFLESLLGNALGGFADVRGAAPLARQEEPDMSEEILQAIKNLNERRANRAARLRAMNERLGL